MQFIHLLAQAQSTLRRAKKLKTEVSFWKFVKCFPSTKPEEFINAVITGHFGSVCVWKDLRQRNRMIFVSSLEVIISDALRSKNVFCLYENAKPAFSNSSGLKSVVEKLRFHEGLVWMVGIAVEIKSSCIFKFLPRIVFKLKMAACAIGLEKTCRQIKRIVRNLKRKKWRKTV